MEEKQAILANVLRKVLAKDRSILARREDFIQAMAPLVTFAVMREYRALTTALQESNLGEILLAADQKSPEERQAALGQAREMLLEKNMQEKTVERVIATLTDALDWGKEAQAEQAAPAAGAQTAPQAGAAQPQMPEAEKPQAAAAQQPAATQTPWACVCGHQGNTSAFCTECGRSRAEGERQAAAQAAPPVATAAGTQRNAVPPVQPQVWPEPAGQAAGGAAGRSPAEAKKRMALIAAVVVLLGILVFFGVREFGSQGSGTYASLVGKQATETAKEAKTDLSLGGLDLGDKKSDIEKAKLGKENDTKEESGLVFHYYDDVQVATDGDEVVGLKSVSDRLATKRGIHQGDSLADVKKAYGSDFQKSAGEDGMTYYEYAFQTDDGEEGLLRFAVRNSDQKVGYISARLTRYEKAKAQPNTQQAAAPAADARGAQVALNNFYNAISHKDYSGAWQMMTPEQQKRMGDYDSFRQGYSTTLSSEARNVTIASAAPDKVVLTYRLLARDRMPGGKVKAQVFDCSATMVPSGGNWKLLYTEAKQVSSRVE
ncbi:MAG: hypothetical protein MR665_04960 [Selenomonas bovis]|nr:hypothetical protein [Selenomonas bovis]